ncbi:MAG: HupE/UreJ family protein [Oceanospirillaceae bacterium]|nr:HupE/UreJ family protein [Oceanospirillaceae bacterium]
MPRLLMVFTWLLVCLAGPAGADEFRPAYLELQQTGPDVFEQLWKVPAKGQNGRLAVSVRLPDEVEVIEPARTTLAGGAFLSRSTIRHPDALVGATIAIEGLERLVTDAIVRIHWLNGATEVTRLTPESPAFVVPAQPTTLEVAKTYLLFGIEHILEGVDHLLFVACLIFIARTWHRLLVTISGFTLAHSITLSLASLGILRVPVPPTEAAIALSIVFLAREIACARPDTLTWRYPIAVSSLFGLMHGLGFASALGDIGLPETEIPAALLAFNAGVEVGQVAFVATVLAALWVAASCLDTLGRFTSVGKAISLPALMRSLEQPLAYGVGGFATLWSLERIFALYAVPGV